MRTTLKRRAGAVLATAGMLMMLASPAMALTQAPGPITVDGVQYAATKVSGPTVHYETPDTNPQAASTERHTWTGNGAENLPCPYGIHWIDNANVLTISHCLPGETTTTTTDPTTTTTHATTTTTQATTTTTTQPNKCDENSPTWNESTQDCTLPFTGAGDWAAPILAAGLVMFGLGGGLLGLTRKEDNARA